MEELKKKSVTVNFLILFRQMEKLEQFVFDFLMKNLQNWIKLLIQYQSYSQYLLSQFIILIFHSHMEFSIEK